MKRWWRWANSVRTEIDLYRRMLQHTRTPRLSRWLLGFALLYLASPVDLIPDWLPVLGQLDDLVIVPYLVRLALRGIPPDVVTECRDDIQNTH